eukprot:TRINITY_DN25686_c0_g2_i1.p1 TRINITY_DN25686_c0_g2~~TRINITY_DN25686_c0_g2_i1.p1  ORF type:complete len:678 (-),score=113.20 TRINITY_DN25686_c0_g2_i1:105-2138(-)
MGRKAKAGGYSEGNACKGPWICEECGLRHAGALVSRTECDCCGRQRSSTAAEPVEKSQCVAPVSMEETFTDEACRATAKKSSAREPPLDVDCHATAKGCRVTARRSAAEPSRLHRSELTEHWPREAFTARNAGVMLVGYSSLHGMPAIVLGGRWYTGKKTYAYTDFGGGVDKEETPQRGAMREFVEELLGFQETEADEMVTRLCEDTVSELVGGRPFVSNGHVIFVVSAEAVLEALPQGTLVQTGSAIDTLFATARQNDELTSVALVSIEELIRGALNHGGKMRPLNVRQLDDQERASEEITLRNVMCSSVRATQDALLTIEYPPKNLPTVVGALKGDGAAVAEAKVRRWGRHKAHAADESVEPAWCEGMDQQRMAFVFDMETGDPDDVLTLLFLASHPMVELRAVTVTPGSEEQVALVRWLLQQLGLAHIRLGAQGWPANAKKPVQLKTRFYQSFGRASTGDPQCERADEVLLDCCDESTTLVTGAPLHNLGDVLRMPGFHLGRWVAQGGFAGEGVVPREKQMDKFKGKDTCPTWNFGGNVPAAQAALAATAISRKVCVSKNVCHSVVYDEGWHQALGEAAKVAGRHSPWGRRAVALKMMYETMDQYLRDKPGGKKLHDPLALAVALDESVCTLEEVQLYAQKGQWGSKLCPGSNTWISVAYDAAKFRGVLLDCTG